MIITPSPNTYAQFKVMHSALVNKHDDTVVFMVDTSNSSFVGRIAIVFSKTPEIRIDIYFSNPSLAVADLLVDFPEAIAVSGISVGE